MFRSNKKDTKNEISGYISADEQDKLRHIRAWGSVHRKKTIHIWKCNECKNVIYYPAIRCPLCESLAMTEILQPTQYALGEPISIKREVI
jgi:hypothetical protein